MSAPPSTATNDSEVDPLYMFPRPQVTDSEPICRAWAEMSSPAPLTRQMAAGQRRPILDDYDIGPRQLQAQYLEQCRLLHIQASGPQMTYALRLRANRVLARLHRILSPAPFSSRKRSRSATEAEAHDEDSPQISSSRPSKMVYHLSLHPVPVYQV
ncbi:hypothetical protein R3P38DRAFT_2761269 [Favolaschia claudopus]|uniref:Uncharacterized protein n=1 Tax=Favolaschia claudopus TaxID=2862362 RepID=A0AAW0DX26_9AGAR